MLFKEILWVFKTSSHEKSIYFFSFLRFSFFLFHVNVQNEFAKELWTSSSKTLIFRIQQLSQIAYFLITLEIIEIIMKFPKQGYVLKFRFHAIKGIDYKITRVPRGHSSCSRGCANNLLITIIHFLCTASKNINHSPSYEQSKYRTYNSLNHYNTLPHRYTYARLTKSSTTTRARASYYVPLNDPFIVH